MKKILSILLVLVFALTSFVSCDKIPGLEGMSDKLNFEEILNKVKFWEKDETPSVTLDDAKSYLFNTYKDHAKAPVADYDLVAVVIVDGVKFAVTWTVDASEITIKESSKANFWTVDLPETNNAEKAYTLTATISDAEGNKVEVKFTKTLPVIDSTGVVTDLVENVAYKMFLKQMNLGYTLYATAATQKNENKFILTTLDPKEAADFFVEKADGGYKLYTMVDGAKLYVTASIVTTPNADGTVKISKYIGFSSEGTSVFVYNASIQTFVVTVDGIKFGVGTYNAFETICISEDTYFKPENVNVAGGQFPVGFMTSEYAETLTPDEKPVAQDPAADSTLTIAQALELGNTKVKDQYTEGKYYVTGTVKEIQSTTYGNMVITDGTNEILVYGTFDATGANRYDAMTTKPVAGDTVTVYGIIGMYNAPQIKNGWITAHTPAGSDTPVTPPTPETPAELTVVDTPVAGVAYKLGLFHGNENADVFFNGQNYNNYAWYLAYGNASAAVDVYLEAVDGVDGAYRLFFYNGEAKTYIRMYPRDGDTTKGTMEMTTTCPPEYFTYSTEYKTLIYTSTTGEQFYMGSSGTYKSISTSAIKYITDATSYPAHFYAEQAPHTCEFVAGEVTAPTCTEAGYTTYTCTCGKTEQRDTVAALGHTFADATCTAPKTCACGATEGAALGHTYTSAVTAPTCTQDGYTTYTCTCGDTYTEPGEAKTGHDFTNGDTCANGCGTTQDHVHNFVAGETTAPTCTTPGYTTYTCTCGETENRDPVDALGHSHTATPTAPTCTEAGYTTYTCNCGDTYTEPGEAALGHDYDRSVTAPTCTAAGYTTFSCGICDDTYTGEEVAALGHKDEDNNCFCDTCNALVNCGTLEAPLTATQAQAIGASLASGAYTAQKVYVTGTVTGIGSVTTYYKNVYVSDGTTEFLIFSINLGDGINGFAVGDTITAYGYIQNYNGNTPEMTGKSGDYPYALVVTPHTCQFSDPTCTEAAKCTLCNAEGTAALGHTTEEGTCERCGETIGSQAPVKSYNKVTSAAEFTTGTYVLVGNTSMVTFSETHSSGWVLGTALSSIPEAMDQATGDQYAITLTVTDTGVAIKVGDVYIAPKGGNNNGMKLSTTAYYWAYSFDDKGNITFTGTGSDTVTLAYNSTNSSSTSVGPAYRGYKNTTAAGSTYYTTFVAYKLG